MPIKIFKYNNYDIHFTSLIIIHDTIFFLISLLKLFLIKSFFFHQLLFSKIVSVFYKYLSSDNYFIIIMIIFNNLFIIWFKFCPWFFNLAHKMPNKKYFFNFIPNPRIQREKESVNFRNWFFSLNFIFLRQNFLILFFEIKFYFSAIKFIKILIFCIKIYQNF